MGERCPVFCFQLCQVSGSIPQFILMQKKKMHSNSYPASLGVLEGLANSC